MTHDELRQEFGNKIRNDFLKNHPLCQYCGEKGECVHHIMPISSGGDNRETNLITLCLKCHGKIHNKNFITNTEEWKKKQAEGIAKAKAEGKFRGGQIKKISKDKYIDLKIKYLTREITKKKFAELLEVSRPTLDKILREEELYLKDMN